MPYWITSTTAVGAFAATFALLLFLVYRLRPKIFRFKAVITKWVSVEVELQSPEPINRRLPLGSRGGNTERNMFDPASPSASQHEDQVADA